MATIGTQLGRYKILGPLGSGGMGDVYRARDDALGREIAIKVLPEELAQNREALGRFEREARALAALSHPHILTVHEFNTGQGVSFLVTELLEGETLRDRLGRSTLPWHKALEIGIALAEGLAAAHSKGVVHRDLKPENVFLSSDGGVKILDFGLAHLEPQPGPPEPPSMGSTRPASTEPGTVMGTVPYMAPEQILGLPADPRSDMFAFGCVLYEMVTGKSPFLRPTAPETRAAILRDDPAALTDSGKKVPPELERVLEHCLEKKPEDRFQSARDLAFDLRAIQRGSGIVPPGPLPAPRRGRRAALWAVGAALVLLALGLAGVASWRLLQDRDGAIDSIAVLPFTTEGPDHDTEYLGDGISESLINNLSQLPNVRVIARSSAFRYRGRATDPVAVGKELGVQAVLTGRVAQRGDRLLISVDLVDVRHNRQLWGEQYNRKLADLLTVQDEISREITEKLRLRLSGEEKQRLTKRYTDNTEAYQAYLAGRYHWGRRTEDELKKAVDSFEQARAKDPAYALAYAGLADCYALMGDYGYLPPRDAFPKARAAAEHALQLDDSLAEAHTSLAFVKVQYDWDWAGAEREYRRALELNPNYATAHQWYSEYLSAMGRHEEALREIRRAQELDPLSLIIHAVVGRALYFARRYDDAVAQCRSTVEMDPNFGVPHLFLGRAYVQQGKYEEALAEFEEFHRLSGGSAILAEVGHAQVLAGRRDEARQLLKELTQDPQQGKVAAGRIAYVYVALGDRDQAFAWLEKAYDEHSDTLVFLRVEPRYDSLRSDPRFADLLRRVGLPP
jgi:serine/threonine-protein kinase